MYYRYVLRDREGEVIRNLATFTPRHSGIPPAMKRWLHTIEEDSLTESGRVPPMQSVHKGDQKISSDDGIECVSIPNYGYYCWFTEELVVTGSRVSSTLEVWPGTGNSNTGNYDDPGGGYDPCSYGCGGGTGNNNQDSFFSKYGGLLTYQEEIFLKENPWLKTYVEAWIENGGLLYNPDWPDLGIVANIFMKLAFDHPHEAVFFARYVKGEGNWKISKSMFDSIVADAEANGKVLRVSNSVDFGSLKKVYSLNGTASVYELALGTFTIYYDNNGNPVGMYDEYNFDLHLAEFIDYTGNAHANLKIWEGKTMFGISDRGFFNEWKTRGMNGFSHFIGDAESYKIHYP